MNILCNTLKLVLFTKIDILFLEEFVNTMAPISIALDMLQVSKVKIVFYSIIIKIIFITGREAYVLGIFAANYNSAPNKI